jgi:Calmodulin-binding
MKPIIKTQRIEKCQVAEILSEPKRLTDVNYKKKNYEQLKQAQQDNRKKKNEEETRPPKEPFKIKRFQNVGSVVYKDPEELKKNKERVASAKQPLVVTYDPDDQGVQENKPDLKKDYIKENAKAAISQTQAKLVEQIEENPKVLNPNYGKVPHYIEEYKIQREYQIEKKKIQEEQAKCPPGMKLMPESERLETLEILQKGKDDVWQCINKLPIASNTLTVQRKRAEYESKLIELENAIKTFSKPKVYVALN